MIRRGEISDNALFSWFWLLAAIALVIVSFKFKQCNDADNALAHDIGLRCIAEGGLWMEHERKCIPACVGPRH